MKFLLVLILLFGCSSTEWKDKAMKSISAVAVPTIMKTFTCSNKEAIKSDVDAKLKKWFKITTVNSTDKSMGSMLCTAAVSAILPMLIDFGNSQLNPEWECTSTDINGSITKLAQTACNLIP